MKDNYVEPAINRDVFNCPYCHVCSKHGWYITSAVSSDKKLPSIFTIERMKKIDKDVRSNIVSKEKYKEMKAKFDECASKVARVCTSYRYEGFFVENMHLSMCPNCGKVSVWLYDEIVHPQTMCGPEPEDFMPQEILNDFNEARSIVKNSPRGACALLRLCLQKLMPYLGEERGTLDQCIASLVSKGKIRTEIQQALDTVRVIGNEAVHPGEMNLKDDKDTAVSLMKLLNIISTSTLGADDLIKEMYDTLPPKKRISIAKRDRKIEKLTTK